MVVGESWISEGSAGAYNLIKDEILAKRHEICPFCKEKYTNISSRIKNNHQEELKLAVGCISKEEYIRIRKELITESL